MGSTNSNTNQAVPYFNSFEGIDLTVDLNGKLHIFTTVAGTSSTHTDSLNYIRTYTIGTEVYNWQYGHGKWPYLIDFVGDGTSQWAYKIIDSCGTQGASQSVAFTNTYLPWSGLSYPNPGAGVNGTSMRLQMSRSWDMYTDYILYSWAESDTTLTTNSFKYNEFPNIKLKAYRTCYDQVCADEFAISSPVTGFHPRVRDKAYFHYISPSCRVNGTWTSVQFTLATSVSNNINTDPTLPVDNYYSNAVVQFNFPSAYCWVSTRDLENEGIQYKMFPNPSAGKIEIYLKLEQKEKIEILVLNIVGQKVDQLNYNAISGENSIPMNLQNCKPGIYFVKVKAGNSESTQKLIIE